MKVFLSGRLYIPGVTNVQWRALYQISSYLDYIKTHVNDVLGACAVVSGSGVTLQGIAEVTAVQVMISKVIMTPPKHTTELLV